MFPRLCSLAVVPGFLLVLLINVTSSAATLRFAHCFAGCPVGASARNTLISRAIYTLSFNSDTRIADWVAYVVTSGSIGVATNLSRLPVEDPYIKETLRPEEFADRRARGAERAATDRQGGSRANNTAGGGASSEQESAFSGMELHHFAPLVSFAGTPYRSEVNFLTNMVPRNGELNRGSWYGLEWAVRNLANRSDGVYVVTGPVYIPAAEWTGFSEGNASAEPMRNRKADPQETDPVKVPGGFFKVVVDQEGRVAAFLFPQDLPFHIHHCEQLATVEQVETLSGLDLFPELTREPDQDLSESLGCFR